MCSTRGTRRAAVREALSLAALVLFVLWAAGYFVTGGITASGFGYYRLNLLGPFVPGEIWSIFSTAPWLNGDYEGFCYLGAGIFLLAIAAAVLIMLRRGVPVLNWKRTAPLFVLCVLFYIYALSNHVAFGSHELFAFRTPPAPMGSSNSSTCGRLNSPRQDERIMRRIPQ
jgi:hypothetical protein